MTRWIRRLVQVDHTGADVRLDIPLQRTAPCRNGREMTSTNEDYSPSAGIFLGEYCSPALTFVIVLQQQWPLRGRDTRRDGLGLNAEIDVVLGRSGRHFD